MTHCINCAKPMGFGAPSPECAECAFRRRQAEKVKS